MNPALKKLRDKLVLLETFEAVYNVGQRGYVGMIGDCLPPSWWFDAARNGLWVRETFGVDGWTQETDHDHARFVKTVDGVRVVLKRAYEMAEAGAVTLPEAFFTGQEAVYPPIAEVTA